MNFAKYLLARCLPFALVMLAIETALRVALAFRVGATIAPTPWVWPHAFAVGLTFDLVVLAYLLLPYGLYLVALPRRWHNSRGDRYTTVAAFFTATFVIVYSAAAEWIFWDEFRVRFNFIAVDYLVYTEEVLANIWQSYPVTSIIAAELLIASLITFAARRSLIPVAAAAPPRPLRVLLATVAIIVLLPPLLFLARENADANISVDEDLNELAKNGIFSFFAAFRQNELPYRQFFIVGYNGHEPPPIQTVLEEDELGERFLNPDSDDITRYVPGHGEPRNRNVVFVVMESMSARFMQRFGWPGPAITPNLDRLAGESLFFDRAFATGTRTVRGLEAITLSVPPTPGRSIIKRPGNENLASLGFVFQERGYDTRFIYGGDGFFDNMNYFFAHNGFAILDRDSFDESTTTFGNAWGLCDEDLYAKSIADANASHAAGRPFMQLLMTSSNHRPYTFPAGRPGIPERDGGRQAGVKYADYALGKYLEDAAKTPWFADTVFVIIADHTANSAGKTELSPEKYHIPFLIYSPGFIKPRIFRRYASQIDVAPIVFGLLDFAYVDRFYGENLLRDFDEAPHVYVANYQKLGYLTGDGLTILRPDRSVVQYRDSAARVIHDGDEQTVLKTIAVYRHASDWQRNLARVQTLPEHYGIVPPPGSKGR